MATRKKKKPENLKLFEDQDTASTATSRVKQRRQHRGENTLNDLDTREWLIATKSVWYPSPDDLVVPQLEALAHALRTTYGDDKAETLLGQIFDSVMLSRPPSRDSVKAQHPATFAESDIEKLILFFTKARDRVLDPFLGSGSTLVACQNTGRHGIGVEVVAKWYKLAKKRVFEQRNLDFGDNLEIEIIEDDARNALCGMPDESIGFIVTSPPYWSMLNKPADHKVKQERLRKGLPTRYSSESADLANLETYDDFLDALASIFRECFRVLQSKRYIAVVVSDFRDKSKFYLYHADIAKVLEMVGFQLAGITVLVQDSKALYPYGMPHAFVSNIHHQYVVIARKSNS